MNARAARKISHVCGAELIAWLAAARWASFAVRTARLGDVPTKRTSFPMKAASSSQAISETSSAVGISLSIVTATLSVAP
jgi:hypothetical protein